MPRIRLYESALHDARYVFGAPVPFTTDPKIRKAHDEALARALEAEALRDERAATQPMSKAA